MMLTSGPHRPLSPHLVSLRSIRAIETIGHNGDVADERADMMQSSTLHSPHATGRMVYAG
jgi:hypothetical protein